MHTVFDFAAKRAELSPDAIAFEEVETGRRLTFAAVQRSRRARRGGAGAARHRRGRARRHPLPQLARPSSRCCSPAARPASSWCRSTGARRRPSSTPSSPTAARASSCMTRRPPRSLQRSASRRRARLIDFAAYETLIARATPPRCAAPRHRLAHRPHLVSALHLRHHRPAQGRDPDRRHGARQLHQRAAGDRPHRRRPHRQLPAAVPHRRHQPAHAARCSSPAAPARCSPSSRSTRCST